MSHSLIETHKLVYMFSLVLLNRYTYGQPVEGKVRIHVSANPGWGREEHYSDINEQDMVCHELVYHLTVYS